MSVTWIYGLDKFKDGSVAWIMQCCRFLAWLQDVLLRELLTLCHVKILVLQQQEEWALLFVKRFSTECEHNIFFFIVDIHRCLLKSNCPQDYFAVPTSEECMHNSVFFIVERDKNIFKADWHYFDNCDSHVHVLTGFLLSLLWRCSCQTFIAGRCHALEPQVSVDRSKRFGHARGALTSLALKGLYKSAVRSSELHCQFMTAR